MLLHRQEGSFDFEIRHFFWARGEASSGEEMVEPASLQVILNQSGEGLVMTPSTRITLLPSTLAVFHTPEKVDLSRIVATRFGASETHEFLVLTLSQKTVEDSFGPLVGKLQKNLGILRRWSARERQLYSDLVDPPVSEDGKRAWYLSKVLEILSLHLFHHSSSGVRPLFCTTIKENAHRHVHSALGLLEARLAEPLDLQDLASDVGCAPHYLSRLVKQDTGRTLSLHLRAFRIEKAAELLADRSLNITEVALEVGYQSLSHFSKAFAQEKGLTPSEFLKRKR